MKTLVFFFTFFAVQLSFSGQVFEQPVQSLESVDVSQYLGRWYQIARNPLPFEPLNCACAQQTLGLLDSGEVSVYNSCNVGGVDGQLIEIRGTAISQNEQNSQFTVDFGLPTTGQYWIIAVAEDYSWAVVTDPDRRSLYILSKTPELDLQSYTNALNEASKQISIGNLVVTSQNNCTYPE
jgi:apolipoprotein D and lipocalin family protein